ncbi:hypothetical protein ACYRFT_01420 [Listeria kieliensis]
MENEIMNHDSMTMIAEADLSKVTQQLQQITNFQNVVQSNLKSNQDYGVIPGTNKPTLLKPGAEKIQMLFGITSEYEEIERIQDYDKGFFAYTVKCLLYRNGSKITEGLGHCNTKEKKYIKQDPYTLANTCLKMAKKRAQVDATLTISSLSEVFTQDIEDMKEYTQQENLETMTLKDAKNYKLNFGKHKGNLLIDVDKGYLKWLHDGEKTDPVVRKACALVLEYLEGEKGNAKKDAEKGKKMMENLKEMTAKFGATDEESTKALWASYGLNNKEDMTDTKILKAINDMQNDLNKASEEQEKLPF